MEEKTGERNISISINRHEGRDWLLDCRGHFIPKVNNLDTEEPRTEETRRQRNFKFNF